MAGLSIHDKINFKGLVEEFPIIGREQFLRRFKALKIGKTGQLENTFRVNGGFTSNSVYINIIYEYYADFVNLGVGRGLGLFDRNISRLLGIGRTPKNWKKEIARQKHRFSELYTDMVAKETTKTLTDEVLLGQTKTLQLFKKI